MRHSNRLDLHERLIRMYSLELQDQEMDPEVRDQLQKKYNKTVNLRERVLELIHQSKTNRENAE
jgi:hypothetical protein